MSAIALSQLATGGSWQQGFMAVLPAITAHANIRFRELPAEKREEAIQEAIAAACVNYRQLAATGRLHMAYPGSLADLAVRHVRLGRHVGGKQDAAKDPLSFRAQRRHRLRVESYDEAAPAGSAGDLDLMLIARRGCHSIPGVAAFRIDLAEWLRMLSRRERRIIRCFVRGDRTVEVADRFGVSPARVSQLRRRFERDWLVFQGEWKPAVAA